MGRGRWRWRDDRNVAAGCYAAGFFFMSSTSAATISAQSASNLISGSHPNALLFEKEFSPLMLLSTQYSKSNRAGICSKAPFEFGLKPQNTAMLALLGVALIAALAAIRPVLDHHY